MNQLKKRNAIGAELYNLKNLRFLVQILFGIEMGKYTGIKCSMDFIPGTRNMKNKLQIMRLTNISQLT